VRSVSGLLAVDLGFDPRGVVAIDVSMTDDDFDPAQRRRLFEAVRERVAQLPGVTSAAWTNRLPVRDGGWQGPVSVEGVAALQGTDAPNALFREVSPGFLEAMRIRVTQGRSLEAGDREGALRVALVNQAFAQRAWPGQDPLGRRLRLGVTDDTVTVVGVTADVRTTTVTGSSPFVTWVSDAQGDNNYKTLVVRVEGAQPAVLEGIRRITIDVDPRIATNRPTTMDDVMAGALSQPLQLRFFLSLFGVLALTLGMVGIYSVSSYAVVRRRPEIGVRMALGASPGRVLRSIVRDAVVPVAIGSAAGLTVAIAMSRALAGFLYGVSGTDPISLSGAAAALLLAGGLAAAIPAIRASRVSPAVSLAAD
jgi:predicted permease